MDEFWICGFLVKSLLNKNCYNLGTIVVKLGQLTKLNEENKTTSKKIDGDVVSTNYDLNIFFPKYGQFRVIGKPDSEHIACSS